MFRRVVQHVCTCGFRYVKGGKKGGAVKKLCQPMHAVINGQ